MPTSNETYIYSADSSPKQQQQQSQQQQQETKMRSHSSMEQNRTESMKDLANCIEQNGLKGYLSNESIQCTNNNHTKSTSSIHVNTTMSSMNDISMTSNQNSGNNSITGCGAVTTTTILNSSSSSSNNDVDRDKIGGAGGTGGTGQKFSTHPHQNGHVTEKMSRTNLYIKGLPENFDDEQLWQLPPDQTKIKSVKAATDEDTKCRG
ncbi:unnamed protein product, partial [Schistosoma turkestanicum]